MVAKIEKATKEKLDVVWNLTLATNLISANVKYGQIEAIKAISGVDSVVVVTPYEPDVVSSAVADPNMATSGVQTGTSASYDSGYTGAGSRIAIIDTGLDIEHQSFNASAFAYSLSNLAGKAGMTSEAYIESLDLLDAEEIASVLAELNVAKKANVTAEDIYINSKVPFGFNYIDANTNVIHLNDGQGEHGSHVAGITTANSYIANEDGTSMAAPQVAGMAALVAQYIRENELTTKTGLDARTLAQSLLMSTSVPVLEGDNGGYYHSVLKQGSGLANVGAAVMADSYILMNADATASYADGKVNSADGQLLLDYATGISVEIANADAADIDGDDKINSNDAYLFFKLLGESGAVVPANGSVNVEVTVTLSDSDKEWLANYENGAYLEGFVYAQCVADAEGEEIPANGHSFGEWAETKASTCTEAGEKTRSCACGETETEKIAATGHKYSSVVTAPSTEAEGYTTHTCEHCGDSYVDSYTDKLPVPDPDNGKTGDDFVAHLWIMCLMGSAAALAVLVIYGKKSYKA